MHSTIALVSSLLFFSVQGSSALPANSSAQIARACTQFYIPVAITDVKAAKYAIPALDSDIAVTAWAVSAERWSASPFDIAENITISGTFNIHAQYCTPESPVASKADTLQIATHGLVYDKRYWDVEIDPSQYSYVDAALSAGYPILTYDRLGTGKSDKPDASTVVQARLQLEILRSLTLMARDGHLLNLVKQQNPPAPELQNIQPPTNIIHIGHSYGSILTAALLATYGNLSDAAILTGFIPNAHMNGLPITEFDAVLARTYSPAFADRGDGYIVPATRSALQATFFAGSPSDSIGGFEKQLLDYGDEVKQPATATEFLSAPTLKMAPALDFTGPVQYNEGEFDNAMCCGDCRGAYNETMLGLITPFAKAMEVHLQPSTGHGLTFHRNATAGYKVGFEFLGRNGL